MLVTNLNLFFFGLAATSLPLLHRAPFRQHSSLLAIWYRSTSRLSQNTRVAFLTSQTRQDCQSPIKPASGLSLEKRVKQMTTPELQEGIVAAEFRQTSLNEPPTSRRAHTGLQACMHARDDTMSGVFVRLRRSSSRNAFLRCGIPRRDG